MSSAGLVEPRTFGKALILDIFSKGATGIGGLMYQTGHADITDRLDKAARLVTFEGHECWVTLRYSGLLDCELADSPGEVDTVILLRWDTQTAGQYGKAAGWLALRITCEVTVIDWRSRTIVAHKRILGGDPPKEARRTAYGSAPYSAIREYLTPLLEHQP